MNPILMLLRSMHKIAAKNKITKNKEYAEIELYDSIGNVRGKVKIDLDDIDKVEKYRWYLRNRQAVAYINDLKRKQYIHRYLMGNPENMDIDHIDRNPLNNVRSNLRIVPHVYNTYNRRYKNHNIFPGIYKSTSGKYRVRITHDGKTIHLGVFNKLDDAIKARLKAEKKYFGEYAPVTTK